MPRLKQLEVLACVADHENFARAGQALGFAQPTISRSIGLLEEEFGHPLFDRTKRSAVLNADGQELLTRARRVLRVRDRIERLLKNQPEQEPRRILVGVPDLVAATWLAPWSRAVRHHHPKVTFCATVGGPGQLRDLLLRGAVDMAVVDDVDLPPSLARIALPVIALQQFSRQQNMPPAEAGAGDGSLLGQVAVALSGMGAVALPRDIDPEWLQRHGLQRVPACPMPILQQVISYRLPAQDTLIQALASLGQACCDYRHWTTLVTPQAAITASMNA